MDTLKQKLVKGTNEFRWDRRVVAFSVKLIDELQRNGVTPVRFAQKLSERANNKEQFFDILIEGRFATVLARNNFLGIEIEYADKGADIKAGWNGSTIYFEVTRRAPNREDICFSQGPGNGESFVAEQIRTETILGKIQGKLQQLENGATNIVVYCSETVSMGQPNMEEAFKYIKREIQEDTERYKQLSGVLFTESVFNMDLKHPFTELRGFRLFRNEKASSPLGVRLTKKLNSLDFICMYCGNNVIGKPPPRCHFCHHNKFKRPNPL